MERARPCCASGRRGARRRTRTVAAAFFARRDGRARRPGRLRAPRLGDRARASSWWAARPRPARRPAPASSVATARRRRRRLHGREHGLVLVVGGPSQASTSRPSKPSTSSWCGAERQLAVLRPRRPQHHVARQAGISVSSVRVATTWTTRAPAATAAAASLGRVGAGGGLVLGGLGHAPALAGARSVRPGRVLGAVASMLSTAASSASRGIEQDVDRGAGPGRRCAA